MLGKLKICRKRRSLMKYKMLFNNLVYFSIMFKMQKKPTAAK